MEGAGLALEGGGIWFEVELIAGGGGRPGLDLIGGGRSGRKFAFEGLEKRQENDLYQKRNRSWSGRKNSYCFLFVLTALQQIYLAAYVRSFLSSQQTCKQKTLLEVEQRMNCIS